MSALDDWISAVCRELGLADLDRDERNEVLDLVRDVAHGVMRPAAPVTAYLVGLAVGRGADRPAANAAGSALVGGWTSPDGAAQDRTSTE